MAGKAIPGKVLNLDEMFGVKRRGGVTITLGGRDYAIKNIITQRDHDEFLMLMGKEDYKGFARILQKPSEAKAFWDALQDTIDFRDFMAASQLISNTIFNIEDPEEDPDPKADA